MLFNLLLFNFYIILYFIINQKIENISIKLNREPIFFFRKSQIWISYIVFFIFGVFFFLIYRIIKFYFHAEIYFDLKNLNNCLNFTIILTFILMLLIFIKLRKVVTFF
jgi:hypothetical protein